MNHSLTVDAESAVRAAQRLDGIATRLEEALAASRDALTVPAAGSDEVSTTAAKTFNSVAESFDQQVVKGIAAIREVAESIRVQTQTVVAQDAQTAAEITVI